ncbi:MAG: hypothetical protein ACRD2W_14945 [Acidimicrobiales bacterium]
MTGAGSRPLRGSPGVNLVVALLGPIANRHAPTFFRIVRRRWPVLVTPWFSMVASDADVRQVLGCRDDFSVARYTSTMMEVVGPFVLGLDDPDTYGPADDLLQTCLRPEDAERVGRRAGDLAQEAISWALAGREIDVVSEFVDPVLAKAIGEYVGIPGPDWETLAEWSRVVFTEVFVSGTRSVRPPALKVVREFRAYIESVVGSRGAALDRGECPPDDVLARLLASGADHRQVCGTLLALVVASFPNLSKMAAIALHELLRRPEQLRAAEAAARAGDAEMVAAYLFEAARLRPMAPGIFRTSTGACPVGLFTNRPTTVPAGVPILAATASAMMDEHGVAAPHEFRVNRPATDYLHFGYGLHECAGGPITRAVLPAVAGALLRHGPLRRAPGRAGRLKWRYPYPCGLRVRFSR